MPYQGTLLGLRLTVATFKVIVKRPTFCHDVLDLHLSKNQDCFLPLNFCVEASYNNVRCVWGRGGGSPLLGWQDVAFEQPQVFPSALQPRPRHLLQPAPQAIAKLASEASSKLIILVPLAAQGFRQSKAGKAQYKAIPPEERFAELHHAPNKPLTVLQADFLAASPPRRWNGPCPFYGGTHYARPVLGLASKGHPGPLTSNAALSLKATTCAMNKARNLEYEKHERPTGV